MFTGFIAIGGCSAASNLSESYDSERRVSMPYYENKRKGWRAVSKDKGGKRETRLFRTKAAAKDWEAQKRRKTMEERETETRTATTFLTLSNLYLDEARAEFVKKTYDEKRALFQTLHKRWGDPDIYEINSKMVLDYLNERKAEVSGNASNKDRKNLLAFFHWCGRIHNILHNPVANIPPRRHERKLRRIIPLADILRVIQAAKGQNRVMLESYWHTGGRRSEIFNWTWSDINFEQRWVRLCTRKNREGEPVYGYLSMNDDLYKTLRWQWEHRLKESEYVFNNPRTKTKFMDRKKFIKSVCEKAEIKSFGFHDIRHAVASYLNDVQKVGLRSVQKVLRHRSQRTTEIYLHDYSGTKEAMTLLEWRNLESTHTGDTQSNQGVSQ
jgi:integrase